MIKKLRVLKNESRHQNEAGCRIIASDALNVFATTAALLSPASCACIGFDNEELPWCGIDTCITLYVSDVFKNWSMNSAFVQNDGANDIEM